MPTKLTRDIFGDNAEAAAGSISTSRGGDGDGGGGAAIPTSADTTDDTADDTAEDKPVTKRTKLASSSQLQKENAPTK